ncbi:MAG: sugar phosphate isomerase/epimerase family protein, partial [Saccharofermentanales bacterium]
MANFLLSAFADEAAGDIDGQIDALHRNDIGYIEIRNVGGINIINHDKSSIKEIKSKLDDGDIKVSAIGSPIGKIPIEEPFGPHLDSFKKALSAAEVLETGRIRIFSFYIPENRKAADYRNEVFDRLSRLSVLADDAGICCCIENEKGIYGDNKSRMLDICEFFGDSMKMVFDPANFIQCGEDPSAIFDDFLPYIDYLHIKDALKSDGS